MIRSSKFLDALEELIDNKFDKIALDFLGIIPEFKKQKRITFSTKPDSIISVFMKALDRKPDDSDEEVLKGLLRISHSYLEALKSRTKARVMSQSKPYIEAQEPDSIKQISTIISKEMEKSSNYVKVLAQSESKTAKNVGTILQIQKIAEEKGIERPVVFYIVTLDDRTAEQPEKNIHLIEGTKIPRLWYLDELSNDYWKKGMKVPSIHGGHPNCFLSLGRGTRYKVYTETRGYVPMADVEIGERVLTHTGKFKKVLDNMSKTYGRKYYGNFYDIGYQTVRRSGLVSSSFQVTPEHQFLTQRGWVEAQNLTKKDIFVESKYEKESEIVSIEKVENSKNAFNLLDLTIEDDESFVINGVISHNCRCYLTMMSPTGFGFSKDGKVVWKGLDYNAIEEQRKEYGMP